MYQYHIQQISCQRLSAFEAHHTEQSHFHWGWLRSAQCPFWGCRCWVSTWLYNLHNPVLVYTWTKCERTVFLIHLYHSLAEWHNGPHVAWKAPIRQIWIFIFSIFSIFDSSLEKIWLFARRCWCWKDEHTIANSQWSNLSTSTVQLAQAAPPKVSGCFWSQDVSCIALIHGEDFKLCPDEKTIVVHSFTCSTYPTVPATLPSKLWVEHLKYSCDWVLESISGSKLIKLEGCAQPTARLENKSRQYLFHLNLTKQEPLPSLPLFPETAIASLQAGPTAAARVEDEPWTMNENDGKWIKRCQAHIVCFYPSKD